MIFGILFLMSFIAAIILIVLLFRVRQVYITNKLILLTALVAFWLLVKAVCYVIRLDELAIFLQKAKYVSIIFIPTLFYVISHGFVKGKDVLKLHHKLMLYAIPSLSLISLFSGGFPYRFISDCSIVYIEGISVFHYTKHIGFYINEVYAFIIMAGACSVLILGAIKSPRIFRKQRILIFIGASISYVINILVVINAFEATHVDKTPIATLGSIYICYWAYFHMPKKEIVPAARELVVETTKDMIAILDTNDGIIDINPAAIEFIKYFTDNKNKTIQKNRFIGLNISDILELFPSLKSIKGAVNSRGESTFIYKIGDKKVYFTMVEAPIYDSDKVQVGKMIVLHDDTELQNMAYYDPLTGTGNRTLFYDRLSNALIRAKESGKPAALIFMDLDRFKVINDTLGHAAGDLILIEVAKRIRGVIGEADRISRFGGDEFTVIIESVDSTAEVKTAAEAIINEITKPYHIIGKEVTLGASIGIVVSGENENNVEDMVRKADAAMYHSKENGRGRYSFSSLEIEKKNNELLEMEIKLRKALTNNEFKLYLQPQIIYAEGEPRVVGAEALIRWITAEGETITPDKFIPTAESIGIISDIGNWILEEILRIDKILWENDINIKLSINVSVKQFENRSFIRYLEELLSEENSKKINLIIEITESMFMQDIDKATKYLWDIKMLGVGLALDDFGTGFSSLSYIYRLPVDYLKIDRTFITNTNNQYQRDLTSAIISMAKSLNLKTVAEGVETEEQKNRLLTEGCNVMQGFYFSKPLKLEDFIDFVKGK